MVEESSSGHGYANLNIIMHAIDPILFSSLRLMITKALEKFHPDPISSLSEKSGTEGQTGGRNRRDNT